MSLITFKHRGNFNKVEKFFVKVNNHDYISKLDEYGNMGVSALSSSTPVDSGETASSWTYEIERTDGRIAIIWSNTNENDGVNIAVILQYGHGTGTGGYVQGRDFINPAMQPVFDFIAEEAWKEVTSE